MGPGCDRHRLGAEEELTLHTAFLERGRGSPAPEETRLRLSVQDLVHFKKNLKSLIPAEASFSCLVSQNDPQQICQRGHTGQLHIPSALSSSSE